MDGEIYKSTQLITLVELDGQTQSLQLIHETKVDFDCDNIREVKLHA